MRNRISPAGDESQHSRPWTRSASVIATVAVLVALVPAAVGAANGCIECHKDPDFYARYPKLYNYYQEWQDSPHSLAGLTCNDCHGGDPDATTAAAAHAGIRPPSDPQSKLYYSNQPRTCGSCHNDKRDQFVQSKHYKALISQQTAPTCTTCHPAMGRRPYLRTIVLNACRTCHEEGNKRGLPEIVDDAERILQQMNVAHGFLGWTRLHYESLGWPDDTRARVESLEQRYVAIVTRVHRFDLKQTDAESAEILAELKQIFESARKSRDEAQPSDGG
jgi:hypothetical protein